MMCRFIFIMYLFLTTVTLFASNLIASNLQTEGYSFGLNENKSFTVRIQAKQVELDVLAIKMGGPSDGIWDFLFSAKDPKGFGGVLLMLTGAVTASVAIGENGGKQNNFLLGAVAFGATGLYLYNSYLNENKTPRRKKEKEKYKPSDWEIAAE